MNFRVDVIIIGDSKAGREVLAKLASNKHSIKFAFISQSFKNTTINHNENIEYFNDEVRYISYKYGLFYCHTASGNNILGTHIVVASGIKYEPFVLNNVQVSCVFNTSDDIPDDAKNQSAIIVYEQETDIKFIREVAKKYQHVYLCTKDINFLNNISTTNINRLTKIKNLTIIPNAYIKNIVYDNSNSIIKKVEFDNYSEVFCSAIYIKTASTPAINFIPKNIISVEEDGYPQVKDNCESTLVPKFFAIGNCLKKYTKTAECKLINSIIKDF